MYILYILVVVIGRIINQRIRKDDANNNDQQPILDDENVDDDVETATSDNHALAAQENTRNSPTKSDGRESISVITINPNSLNVEVTSVNETNRAKVFKQMFPHINDRIKPRLKKGDIVRLLEKKKLFDKE